MLLGPSLFMVILGVLTTRVAIYVAGLVFKHCKNAEVWLASFTVTLPIGVVMWIFVADHFASGDRSMITAYYFLAFGASSATLAYFFFFDDDYWRKKRRNMSEKWRKKLQELVQKVREVSPAPRPVPIPIPVRRV